MTTQAAIFQASDYVTVGRTLIEPATLAYVEGGAGHEKTLQANRDAFADIQLKQRAFGDFSQASTQTQLLGHTLRHPILLAPVAAQTLVHPDGEVATAQAADALEAGMILSTRTAKPIAEVSQAIRQHKWFQLYVQAERQQTLALIKQAEDNRMEALVITLDSPIQSLSIRALQAGFQLPPHAQPVMLQGFQTSAVPKQLSPEQSMIFQGAMQQAPTLDDIQWIMEQTKLPVLVKGVMALDEIDTLRKMGIKGLIVSNHGGRALDGVPNSLQLLSHIRQHVGKDFPLLFDSGIRSGYDVFKAIALGADAVCIGRLQLYALAVNGAHGVAHLLRLLRDELELCMALTGATAISSINQDRLFNTKTHD